MGEIWVWPVRSLDPANCAGRRMHFMPFNVLEGLDFHFSLSRQQIYKGFQPV